MKIHRYRNYGTMKYPNQEPVQNSQLLSSVKYKTSNYDIYKTWRGDR